MTKQGSFKKAARRQARRTGVNYTQARADMERDELRARIWTPVEHKPLRVHLEERYGIRVSSLTPFDGDHPGTFRVDRYDGDPWVARVFSSSARRVDRIEGDAEILRFLEDQGYPAERCAYREPVSSLDGRGVLVTEYVSGSFGPWEVERVRTGAELLARLHQLPGCAGAVNRDGGAFDHDPNYEGRPRQDLAAALNLLNAVADRVQPQQRRSFEALRDEISSADDCEGLPESLTHPNFQALDSPDRGTVVIAWCGAGRGPRLAALAWMLWRVGQADDRLQAIASGYRSRLRLEDEELERLPGALLLRQYYMAAWYYRVSVLTGYQPSGGEGWWPNHEAVESIAAKARSAFTNATRPATPSDRS